ncbi:enolase-phosphatase E1-like [Xenia sp. Carnegie-2017]|uniref:enolase-phosphatase E1-like n=1 Tax=Xenia sp. Carnegie-2017 TaxID=2897299 RepID=UPI001F048079|nr:enolase-phosphatase E1-like [Xenia sp. Carnegie-2017]
MGNCFRCFFGNNDDSEQESAQTKKFTIGQLTKSPLMKGKNTRELSKNDFKAKEKTCAALEVAKAEDGAGLIRFTPLSCNVEVQSEIELAKLSVEPGMNDNGHVEVQSDVEVLRQTVEQGIDDNFHVEAQNDVEVDVQPESTAVMPVGIESRNFPDGKTFCDLWTDGNNWESQRKDEQLYPIEHQSIGQTVSKTNNTLQFGSVVCLPGKNRSVNFTELGETPVLTSTRRLFSENNVTSDLILSKSNVGTEEKSENGKDSDEEKNDENEVEKPWVDPETFSKLVNHFRKSIQVDKSIDLMERSSDVKSGDKDVMSEVELNKTNVGTEEKWENGSHSDEEKNDENDVEKPWVDPETFSKLVNHFRKSIQVDKSIDLMDCSIDVKSGDKDVISDLVLNKTNVGTEKKWENGRDSDEEKNDENEVEKPWVDPETFSKLENQFRKSIQVDKSIDLMERSIDVKSSNKDVMSEVELNKSNFGTEEKWENGRDSDEDKNEKNEVEKPCVDPETFSKLENHFRKSIQVDRSIDLMDCSIDVKSSNKDVMSEVVLNKTNDGTEKKWENGSDSDEEKNDENKVEKPWVDPETFSKLENHFRKSIQVDKSIDLMERSIDVKSGDKDVISDLVLNKTNVGTEEKWENGSDSDEDKNEENDVEKPCVDPETFSKLENKFRKSIQVDRSIDLMERSSDVKSGDKDVISDLVSNKTNVGTEEKWENGRDSDEDKNEQNDVEKPWVDPETFSKLVNHFRKSIQVDKSNDLMDCSIDVKSGDKDVMSEVELNKSNFGTEKKWENGRDSDEEKNSENEVEKPWVDPETFSKLVNHFRKSIQVDKSFGLMERSIDVKSGDKDVISDLVLNKSNVETEENGKTAAIPMKKRKRKKKVKRRGLTLKSFLNW